jgi:exodeoxyribonuclease V gamma subunit
MLRLVYSNRTEELLAELAARVSGQQATGGALTPVRIVAQNATVAEYLRLGIARECGIAANLQTTLITAFAAETVSQAIHERVADADALEAMVLTLLLDESFVTQPDLSPVREHLMAGQSRETADVRRVQLAVRMGRLFEEYTYSRAEMLAGWPQGTTIEGRYAEPERWQRRLWNAMFGAGGLAQARGLRPLHEAIAALSPGPSVKASTVHVFGFAHFAPTFHDFLRRVALTCDLAIYSLSPCEGFWEDFDQRDPAPLRLWGRPGREQVRTLNAAADFDHEDRFVEPEGETLLAALQRDLLRRIPVREAIDPRFDFEGDESIVILEHASVRRELEAVASEIWKLVERDQTLRFDDFAVLIPDSEAQTYLTHLPSVFREAHDIPHRFVDVAPGGDGGVTEAVDLLLSLPLGRFTRQELLRLAIHPAVVATLDVDPGRWLKWCDDLGIVHGADRADHENTYIERDILNWDQGLRRLALGAFMASDASGERRPFELGGEAYVPFEIAASEMRDAAGFGLLIRSLVADARFVQAAELSLAQWASLLGELVGTYVAPTDDAEAERLARCLRRLHGMGEIDLGDRRVPYRIACELARSRIASLHRGRGAEGVTISRLASVQPIPFRVVFACGMGEGRFPSPDSEDPLDLRRVRRVEGDVTGRERDKYAFLELLLGVRDGLYLSYVSRDPLTGDALAASSVVQELLHALSPAFVSDASALRRRHALRRWDPCYFPKLFPSGSDRPSALGTMHLPEARAEARTLVLRQSMEAHGARADRDQVETRAASDPAWASLAQHLGIAPLPAFAPSREANVVVSMHALAKFLDFPLQAWARFRVGLDEVDEKDAMSCEDEPFETERREETVLLRRIFLAAATGESLEQAYDEVIRDRELRGSGPSGVFAQGERGEHLRTLETWKEQLASLGIPLNGIEVHRFGRAGEHATADHVHPPLIVQVDVADTAGATRIVRAEIGGRTLPLGCGTAFTSITLSRHAAEKQDDWTRADRQRAMLRAFVDHSVLAASGVAERRAHGSLVVVATQEGPIAERVVFEPISPGEATVWLRDLVRELLAAQHAYFLPSEALLVWRNKAPAGPLLPWLETARDRLRDGDGPLALRSAYGPVPRPQEYPIPEESLGRAMFDRRFGAIFEKCKEVR